MHKLKEKTDLVRAQWSPRWLHTWFESGSSRYEFSSILTKYESKQSNNVFISALNFRTREIIFLKRYTAHNSLSGEKRKASKLVHCYEAFSPSLGGHGRRFFPFGLIDRENLNTWQVSMKDIFLVLRRILRPKAWFSIIWWHEEVPLVHFSFSFGIRQWQVIYQYHFSHGAGDQRQKLSHFSGNLVYCFYLEFKMLWLDIRSHVECFEKIRYTFAFLTTIYSMFPNELNTAINRLMSSTAVQAFAAEFNSYKCRRKKGHRTSMSHFSYILPKLFEGYILVTQNVS